MDKLGLLNQIDAKKVMIDSKKPFPLHTLASLREKLLVEWTYHSNANEGNTLTLLETKVVLEGITVGGKKLREHLEVINHKEAIYTSKRSAVRVCLTPPVNSRFAGYADLFFVNLTLPFYLYGVFMWTF